MVEDSMLEIARFMREAEERVRAKMALRQHGTAFVEAARDMIENSKLEKEKAS